MLTRPWHILQMCTHFSLSSCSLTPGSDYFHKARRNGKLIEKLSGGLVGNHGHGQIVFRSSATLIIKLWTAFFSFCSLGKIDCVLKSSPLFTQTVLITILYSWTASCCCGHLYALTKTQSLKASNYQTMLVLASRSLPGNSELLQICLISCATDVHTYSKHAIHKTGISFYCWYMDD